MAAVASGGAGGGAARRGADVVTADLLPGADVTCDVSDAEQVESLFAAVGAVDGLVNSAALLVDRRPYDEIELDEWDRMFAVNVRGSFLCARAAARAMGERRWQHRQRRLGDRAHRVRTGSSTTSPRRAP